VGGGILPRLHGLLGRLVADGEVLALRGVVIVALSLHAVPGLRAGRIVRALGGVVGEEAVLGHVLGVALGGDGQGVGEDHRPQAVLLAVIVDEPDELQLLVVVGGGRTPAAGEPERGEQDHGENGQQPPVPRAAGVRSRGLPPLHAA
jgi:hypothetical protein